MYAETMLRNIGNRINAPVSDAKTLDDNERAVIAGIDALKARLEAAEAEVARLATALSLIDEARAKAVADNARLREIARDARDYTSPWHYDAGLEDEYDYCAKALERIANSGQDAAGG